MKIFTTPIPHPNHRMLECFNRVTAKKIKNSYVNIKIGEHQLILSHSNPEKEKLDCSILISDEKSNSQYLLGCLSDLLTGKKEDFLEQVSLKEFENYCRESNNLPAFEFTADDVVAFEAVKDQFICAHVWLAFVETSPTQYSEQMTFVEKANKLVNFIENSEYLKNKYSILSFRPHEITLKVNNDGPFRVGNRKLNETFNQIFSLFLSKNLFLERENIIFE